MHTAPSSDASTTSAATVPIVQGLFTGQGEAARLLASRCRGCGSVYFPRGLSCRHPRCATKQLEDLPLGPQGTLYSFTVQAYRPPALFVMDAWAPYAIGLIELPEGLRVMAMLTGRAPADWRIGEAVTLTTGVLYRNEAGEDVLTYQFRPASPTLQSPTAHTPVSPSQGAPA